MGFGRFHYGRKLPSREQLHHAERGPAGPRLSGASHHAAELCGSRDPAGHAKLSFLRQGKLDDQCRAQRRYRNYQDLRSAIEPANAALIAPELTTDTKIIPLQVEKHLIGGLELKEAFRRAVNDFEGSHAIAMQSNLEPGKMILALKGSGQSIYVGLCKDHYIFSSELYGIVEETPFFLKMDGETTSPADDAASGQVFVLDQDSVGNLAGIRAFFYDGTALELADADIRKAEITTRDIDRGSFPHFFLKEISESALSVKKTLRGKYRISAKNEVVFNLGEDILPGRLRKALMEKNIRNIFVSNT